MLHTTAGIILHSTPYSENSRIVRIYTRELGLQSAIISSKSRKARNRALIQPMSLVTVVLSGSARSDLSRITEISTLYPYSGIPGDMRKSSVLIFINEILYKSLREPHPDADLFDFLRDALTFLDLTNTGLPVFHLFFLVRLSRFFGFYPQGQWTEQLPYFDLQEGRFTSITPSRSPYLDRAQAEALQSLLQAGFDSLEALQVPKAVRNFLLDGLITYYRLHIQSMGEIKSQKVLQEVIS